MSICCGAPPRQRSAATRARTPPRPVWAPLIVATTPGDKPESCSHTLIADVSVKPELLRLRLDR
eukprot:COSAG06_NODE_5130_length_3696_cov_2.216847_2_plen_64_part_00